MNELDKIFQSKLENHTAEYSEQSWDKIQSRLKNQKSKPKALPWLWMSLFAVVAVGALYFWINTNDTASNSIDGVTNPIAIDKDSRNQTKVIDFAQGNATSEAQLSETDAINSTTVTGKTSARLTNDTATNSQLSKTSDNPSRIINADNSVSKESGIFQGNNDIEISNKILTKTNRTQALATGNVRIDANVVSNHQTTFLSDNIQESNIEVSSGILKSGANRVTDIRPIRTIGVSAYTTLHSEQDISEISLSKSMMDDFRQDCPSFVTDRTGVYLDLYLSHELPFRSLKAKAQALEPYAALRSNSEGPTYSFSAGARLTLMLPNGLGLKTGLNFSQVNEKFTHVDTESDIVKEVVTTTIIDGVTQIDTNTIIIPGTRDIVSTNKYRSFDIPLLLSYEWDVMERTYVTVNGGAYLNLLFKESGKILSPSGEVIDLADSSSDKLAIFKNNIGISLFGSVGLHYRMNSSIDLILEPNIRMVVKSATVDAYSLEHSWMTVGLITGMRYNF